MYYESEIAVTVRVPPNRFGERIDKVVLELAREKYESSVHPDIGMIVAILGIRSLLPGKIVPGDGSTYHEVIFSAISFKPTRGEIIEGEVAETIKFGIFIRIGCTDTLCHVSQISNDKFALARGKNILVGRDTGRALRLGDSVRSRIIQASIDHVSMKIAVTMRGEWLGTRTWMKEDAELIAAGERPVGSDRKKRRRKRKAS
ncbi:MAG: DNA-directed RNA polymerase [Candidatus Hodarchaeales archaeon]